MYAIVRTGGKQYRVEEGRSVVVERLPAEEGATVELGEVLLIAEDGTVTIGAPTIDGARVLAHVDGHGRDKKIIVFKYKSKVRYRKKTGHRQHFTRLTVQEILRPGEEAKAKPKRARRAKAEAALEAETPEAEAEAIVEPVAETPVIEETPKRRIRRAAPKAKAKPAPAKAAKPKREPRAKAVKAKDETKKPARRRILRRKKKE